MEIGLELIKVMEFILIMFSEPQFLAAVPEPQGVFGAEPATKSVLPLNKAVVAPWTGRGVLTVLLLNCNTATLACFPPHSAPQFRMYAAVPSALKIAPTGRSRLGLWTTVRGFAFVPTRIEEIMVIASELSLNTKISFPPLDAM